MNQFTASRFVENIKRLALGLEPLDAARGGRVAHPIQVIFPETLRGLPRPSVDRHDSCLHALLYQPGVAAQVDLRFAESARRFVPRQIRYPILTLEQAEALDYRNRVRRPVLFPGAAYDVVSLATGIRGRVERGGQPLRWCRIEARLPGNGGAIVGRAHGDDRGEFLLLIEPRAAQGPELVDPLTVRVDVFAPAAAPVPNPADLPSRDPFWDLPTETAAALDPDHPETDPVSAGEVLPANYTASTGRNVEVPLGTILSEVNVFSIA